MEDTHDYNVADETKHTCHQHVLWLFYHLPVYHALCGLDKKFTCDDVDDCNVEERTQGFCFLKAEGEVGRRGGPGAQPDCSQGDEVGQNVGKEMKCVGEDGDGVGEVAPHEFYSHEHQRQDGYFDEFGRNLFVLLIHRKLTIFLKPDRFLTFSFNKSQLSHPSSSFLPLSY